MEKRNEIVLFVDGNIELEVPVTPEQETVWLTQEQMSQLFDTARSSIAYHINNIFKEKELDKKGYAVNNNRISQLGEVIRIMKRTEQALDGRKLIEDYTLVALTIMIAESRPEEKEMMISVIMNYMD